MEDFKFNIGDKVEIINYGHIMWESKTTELEHSLSKHFPILKEDDKFRWIDVEPKLVGQTGIVSKRTETQGQNNYALEGPNKHAWYAEVQLKMINKNPNNE